MVVAAVRQDHEQAVAKVRGYFQALLPASGAGGENRWENRGIQMRGCTPGIDPHVEHHAVIFMLQIMTVDRPGIHAAQGKGSNDAGVGWRLRVGGQYRGEPPAVRLGAVDQKPPLRILPRILYDFAAFGRLRRFSMDLGKCIIIAIKSASATRPCPRRHDSIRDKQAVAVISMPSPGASASLGRFKPGGCLLLRRFAAPGRRTARVAFQKIPRSRV